MVEIDEEYCFYAQKRLEMAERDPTIQGYCGGVFWERNTLKDMKSGRTKKRNTPDEISLFF